MKVDRKKLDVALARECKSITDLRKILAPATLTKIRNNPDYDPAPKIIGLLAKALNCDVTDLIAEDAP